MSAPLLQVNDLCVSFETDAGRLLAVDHINFHVNAGEILGIVGESGSGKSVSAMSLLRLVPSPPGVRESGTALFDGQDLLSMPLEELRKVRGNDISVIFQEPMTALSPLHKIGNQIMETIRLHREIPKDEARALARDWLARVGIPDVEQKMLAYPHQLSGGMRQRVMIAMALVLEPRLIIADEPTTALDVTIQAQIFDLIKDMKAKNTAMILITHDMGVVWEMCDRVAVMYGSRIVEEALTTNLYKHPHHPYTRALLDTMPALAKPGTVLPAIDGQVPSPLNYPAGCRFADRCSHVQDTCRSQLPPLATCAPNHQAACLFPLKEDKA